MGEGAGFDAPDASLEARGEIEGPPDWDLRTDKVYFSPRWMSMLGYRDDAEIEPTPEVWFSLVHPNDLDALTRKLREHFEAEHRIRQSDGSYHWVLSRSRRVQNEKGDRDRFVGSQIDIKLLKTYEAQLLHDATHDRLTGLPNHQRLLIRLRETSEQSERGPESRLAVLFLDLDGFKEVNYSLGHLDGDRLLATVGERLKRVFQGE